MKNRFLILAALLVAVTLVPGCAGLEKMKKNASQIRYKVTPEVPETHAGNVNMAINGIFPGKYFDKKATLTATPVIKYSGGETALPPVILQGERVNNNYRVISYNAGGNFSYKETFGYKDDMRLSDIVMKVKASKGKKSVEFEPVKIGQGILATSTLMATMPKPLIGVRREANNTGKYDPAIDPFQRIVPDEMLADINFLINSATLRKEESQASDVKDLLSYTSEANADARKELKRVEISAYASPDGSLDLNTDLSSKREKVSTAFMEEELKKAKVETNLRSRYTPEDWEGFREMLENSDIQDKDLILRVLSMYTDPEVREREIKNLSNTFTRVSDEILPKLRRAKMLTSINIIGKTDEEIIAIASANPESLNQAELLYAASLSEDADTKLKIYNSFSRIFSNDWRGPNNAGAVMISQFKYAEAKQLLEKAEKLKNEEPIVKNNLGAIYLVEGDIKKAEEYFGAASGSGKEVNYNLGLVSLKNGDYNRANQYFGDFADPNTSLVKILSGNYNGALSDLEAFTRPNCFAKEYQKAIIGVRTGNENLFYESLKNAISYNPDLKEKARTDMEFVKYFEAPKFREIVR